MSAQIIDRTESGFTVQVTIPYNHSMLDFEETLQQQLNAAGVLATQEGLRQFDTDGSPITVGSITLTSKGRIPKDYQTPYGMATVERHVYQGPQGGATYCPLDRDARIIVSSTPKFAKMVSSKYAEFGSARVRHDLRDNHGREVSRCLVQDIADAVAAVALGQGGRLELPPPPDGGGAATVAFSLDGTCALMCEDGWRETMVGTISFYDGEGERQHTIYLAATPEYGKATFLGRLEAEVAHVKATYPGVHCVGIADGAKGNWEFLERHTEAQVVDFWHAAEYLGKAAAVLYRGDPATRKSWVDCALPRAETRTRGRGGDLEAVEVAGEGATVGEGTRGCAAGDHVFREPVEGGSDGLSGAGGQERTDRQRGHRSGLQGHRQATAVRFGDEVEGVGSGGGAESAVLELHGGAVGSVLGEDRPVGLPCGRVIRGLHPMYFNIKRRSHPFGPAKPRRKSSAYLTYRSRR